MDMPQIPMAEDVTSSEVCAVKNEVEDDVPSENEELFDISNILWSLKFEAVPLTAFPCIVGPFKLEADTQELEPTSFDNEGFEGPSISAAATLMETSNSSLSTEHQNLSKAVSSRISTSLLQFDSQEVGSDDEGAGGPSTSATETLMGTSNSSLSPEHQNLSESASPTIPVSLLEFDSQEVGSDDEEAEAASTIDTETMRETSSHILSPEHQNQPLSISLNIASESDSQELDRSDEGMMHSTVCRSDDVSHSILSGPKPIVMVKKLAEKAIEELTVGIWRCGSCGKAEKSLLILDLHIDTGCEELSPIECDVCPAVCRNYSNFVVHFMEHQMGVTRKCAICLKESIVDMRQHLVLQGHISPNMSELDFQVNESLVVSQNLSTSGYSNSSKSESDEKGLDDQNLDCLLDSKKHRKLERPKSVHIEKKVYKCSLCKKCFSRASYLKQHQIMHKGKRPFECEICNKSFSSSSYLNIHQRLHTGERPFECETCKKCFSQSSHLKTHQIVHTGERPFKCEICKKCFPRSNYLNIHQRLHTGEKPFKCNLCKKTFLNKSNLKYHLTTHSSKKSDS